jgi:putative DNA primase/helicase
MPDFDTIAERIEPDQLARALGAERAGNGWRCPDPDHEDRSTPSWSPFRHNGRTVAKCHGRCDVTRSAVQWGARVWGCTDAEAAERLADAAGLNGTGGRGAAPPAAPELERGPIDDAIPAALHRQLMGDPTRLDYLRERRGLSRETVERYQLGHDGQRYTIPVRDELGQVRNIRRYKPGATGNKMLSWRIGYGSARLFPIDALSDAPGAPVLLCEGETDCLLARQHGFNAVTATGGAGTWQDAWGAWFAGREVSICYDCDDAGRDGGKTVAAKLYGHAQTVRIVDLGLEDGADITDAIVCHGWTAERLRERIDAAAEWQPAAEMAEIPAPSAADFTDTANADRVAAIHGDHIRYIPKWGSWLVWDGTRWREDDRGVLVAERAKDVGRHLLQEAAECESDDHRARLAKWGVGSLSASRIRAMVELARGIDGLILQPEELDTHPWLLGVENGVVDLPSGELLPPDPARLMTMQAPVEYDPEATAPRWDQALREWFPDEGARAYIQRLAGAALVGAQRDHIFVIHYGEGRNGKGTFTRALFATLGKYAVTPHLSLLVQTKHSEHDTVKAALFRARLAVASETERRVRLAEASIKNLTGRDPITCRRMRENPWEFEPTHSLWLQTNYPPDILGRDRGIWSRIRVVPWVARFEQQADDRTLDEALAAERAGILRWAVAGCLAWQRAGLAEPEAVIRATLKYRESQDVFARFAADTGLTFDPDLGTLQTELNAAFDEWAEGEGAKASRKDLTAWLQENGASRKQRRLPDGKRKWYWIGADFSEVSPVSPALPVSAIENATRENNPDDVVTLVTPAEAADG